LPDLRNVAVARNFVIDTIEDRVPDLELVLVLTSELVTNVFQHTTSPVALTVRAGPPVRIEVGDQAAATSAFRRLLENCDVPPPMALAGRGLCIVQAFASKVGLDIDPQRGKVVWFEM